MKSCTLYPSVKTSDGRIVDSKLFKDLLSYTSNNRSETKRLYLITKNPKFISTYNDILDKDEYGEPTLKSLISKLNILSLFKEDDTIKYINKTLGNLNKPKEDTKSNYDTVVGTAINFNDSSEYKDIYVALLKRKDNKIYLSVEPKNKDNERLSAEMKTNYLINNRIYDILAANNISVGTLTTLEEELGIKGVTEFNRAKKATEGIIEIIRIAQGSAGQKVLGEEFAHFVLETMQDDPLVLRLKNLLKDSNVVKDILGEQYDIYRDIYSEEQLIREALGHIVKKHFFENEEPKQYKSFISRLIQRIKDFFKKFNASELEDAIKESEQLASLIATRILNTEQINIDSIKTEDKLYALEKKTIRQAEILDKSIKVLLKRLNLYTKLNSKKDLTEEELNALALKEEAESAFIEELKKDLSLGAFSKGIVSYITNSLEELKDLTTRMTKVKLSDSLQFKAYNLRHIKNYLDGYNSIIHLIKECLKDEDNFKDTKSMEMLKSDIRQFNEIVDDLKLDFNKQALETFANWLSIYMPSEGIKQGDKVITSNDLIDLLQTSTEDSGLLSVWLDSASDNRDVIIKLADQAMKTAKENVRTKVLALQKELLAAAKKLKNAGIKDTLWMFEKDIEGKILNKYISEVDYSKFFYNYVTFLQSIGIESFDQMSFITFEQTQLLEEWEKINGTLKNPNSDIYSRDLSNILSSEQLEYYNTFKKLRNEMLKLLPRDILKEDPNKAIQIRKDLMERLLSTDITTWSTQIKESLKDQLITRVDDDEQGFKTALRDFNNREVMTVPIYYVKDLEDPESISRDTTSTLLAFAEMAINYNEMMSVADLFEIGREVMYNREVNATQNGKPIVEHLKVKGTKINQKINKTEKNFIKAYNELLESQLYNRFLKPGNDIHIKDGLDINDVKLAKFLNKITSLNTLALNALAGIATVANDIIQVNSEVLAKQYFKANHLWNADKIYRKELIGVLGEVGNPIKINKLNLFIEKFDILHNFENEIKDIQWDKSKFQKLLSTNSLYFMMHMGSHWGETRTALAQALNSELTKIDGTKINLWDALEVKYIDPKKPELGATLEPIKGVTLTQEDIKMYTRKFTGLNHKLYGIYNKADKNALSKTSLGMLVMLYKNYFVPSMNRRFARKDTNLDTGLEYEGYYRTLGKFLMNLIKNKDGFYFEILANFRDLDEHDKSNIIRSMNELGSFIILTGLSIMFTNLDWDKEDNPWAKRMTALLSHRLKTEIGGLTPFGIGGETWRLLKSPYAGIMVVEDAFGFFGVLNPWNYEFINDKALITRGKYEGHSKAYKAFMDSPFLPMSNTIYKIMHPETVMVAYR